MGKEVTVEQLQAKVAELEDSLKAEKAANINLQMQLNAAVDENNDLKTVNENLVKEVTNISEKSMQLLVNKAAEKAKETVSTETFEVEGETYGFVSPVCMYKGQRITATEVLASKELQAELVANKIGLIKKQ